MIHDAYTAVDVGEVFNHYLVIGHNAGNNWEFANDEVIASSSQQAADAYRAARPSFDVDGVSFLVNMQGEWK